MALTMEELKKRIQNAKSRYSTVDISNLIGGFLNVPAAVHQSTFYDIPVIAFVHLGRDPDGVERVDAWVELDPDDGVTVLIDPVMSTWEMVDKISAFCREHEIMCLVN